VILTGAAAGGRNATSSKVDPQEEVADYPETFVMFLSVSFLLQTEDGGVSSDQC
jgi:hypothetical protein